MMNAVRISFKSVTPNISIDLPGSKSVSNRALIVNALCEWPSEIFGLSKADDTRILQNALTSKEEIIDVGHAGTAFRFLTAYLAYLPGTKLLTGSGRMKNRPIAGLVSALRTLGAQIEYTETEGYPPLRIIGGQLRGGEVSIETGVSSQYLSALMMIAPYLPEGLEIKLQGEVVSVTYMEMTAAVMRSFGADVQLEKNKVTVLPKPYHKTTYKVESDWSSAACWYEFVHISGLESLTLKGLTFSGLQGDEQLKAFYLPLGIDSIQTDEGILLKNTYQTTSRPSSVNFSGTPDLTPTFLVGMAAKNLPVTIQGVGHLRVKESNRLEVLAHQLTRLGALVSIGKDSIQLLDGIKPQSEIPVFDTYDDHRMAMAFGLLAAYYGAVQINHPEVVRKSYPGFWKACEKLGAELVFQKG